MISRSNLKIKLFVEGLYFCDIGRVWFPIVVLKTNIINEQKKIPILMRKWRKKL
jgi:hypothetical protein